MLSFADDGSLTIDFPDGPVRVRPPTFGGMKRLRAERSTLARDAQDQLDKWDAEHPEPEPPDGDEGDARDLIRWRDDRNREVEGYNTTAAARWWQVALVGDDTFKGLADTAVPADVEDWPADLMYDFRPPLRADVPIEAQLADQTRLIDQVFAHWGKGRSRSGLTASPTP